MIEIDHVTKAFGRNGDRAVAVDDLTLTVDAGEIVALVGSSGSGKTTTLRMINRLDRAVQRAHHDRRPRRHDDADP